MVTIKSIKKHLRKDGTEFITLQLEGGLELVQSQQTGKFYATIRKCSIPSTFDEQTAEQLIGQSMEGTIARVLCQPYNFAIPSTGEVIQLAHTYQYQPVDSSAPVGKREQEFA